MDSQPSLASQAKYCKKIFLPWIACRFFERIAQSVPLQVGFWTINVYAKSETTFDQISSWWCFFVQILSPSCKGCPANNETYTQRNACLCKSNFSFRLLTYQTFCQFSTDWLNCGPRDAIVNFSRTDWKYWKIWTGVWPWMIPHN